MRPFIFFFVSLQFLLCGQTPVSLVKHRGLTYVKPVGRGHKNHFFYIFYEL